MDTFIRVPLLAVDGGGTKCLAVFADKTGHSLGKGRAGSVNYQGRPEGEARRELAKAIQLALDGLLEEDRLCKEKPKSIQIEAALFGMAGLDTETDRKYIEKMIQGVLDDLHMHASRIWIENDGLAALLGGVGDGSGILVIAGTGSIIFGVNRLGQSGRSGGWGHRVGDEGSGYWLGREAVRAVLRAYDGRGKTTSLQARLLAELSLSHPQDLFNWMYGQNYSVDRVASLAKAVGEEAAKGDDVARKLLDHALEELFQGACAVIEQLKLNQEPFQLVLQGGVLQNQPNFRSALFEKIRTYAPGASLAVSMREPIEGILAKGVSFLQKGYR